MLRVDDNAPTQVRIAGTEFEIRADLAFVAIASLRTDRGGVVGELGERLKTVTDARRSTNVVANDRDYRTSIDNSSRRRRASRPVAGVSGRSAKAPGGARRGRVPDGIFRPAALKRRDYFSG